MITALLAMSEITGDKRYFDFAESFIDWFVLDDGSIKTYDRSKYNLDDINEGRVLFALYEKTGKEKYKKAAGTLYQQIKEQPRTFEGNFWHKAIYPNQVWLDGLYMAQPFYALYEKNFGTGDYSDILNQIENVRSHMFDENNKEWTEDDVVELVRTQYGGDAENKEFKTWQKHLVFRDAHGNELTYAQYKAGPRISGKNK